MKKRDFDNRVKKLISNLSEYKKNKHWFPLYTERVESYSEVTLMFLNQILIKIHSSF